jgi:hypothetical protein
MAKQNINLVRLSPELDEKNMARLESRNYERGYTPIPNSALPKTYREGLTVILSALAGEELDPEGSTYAVSAKNGIMHRLYAPAIFRFDDPEVEDGTVPGLAIVWGDMKIPLFIENGDIYTEASQGNPNVKFSVREFGQWKNAALAVTVTDGSNAYSYPFVVRQADLDNQLSVEEFEMMVENSSTVDIAEIAQPAPSGEGGGLFVGPFVKVAQLPIGSYTITGYRSRETPKYGTDYFLQAKVDEPFVAPVSVKEGEEWVTREVEVQDWCIVRPNSAMKKILAGSPVIDEETPAELIVIEHYTTKNGHPAAKVSLQCQFDESDPDGEFLAMAF